MQQWQEPSKISMFEAPSDIEISLKIQGFNEENLLKWASGNPAEVLRVHLCRGACPECLDADNLLHGANIYRRVGEDLPWMSNLVGMRNLVVEGGPARQPPGAGLLSGEAEGGVGVDRGREKVRSTEKKKKEKEKKKGKRGAEKEVRAEAAHAKRSVFEEGPRRS